MDVVADSAGSFSVHFYDVQDIDLRVQFTLTATGQTSGSVAVTQFTDGTISNASIVMRDGATCTAPQGSVPAGTAICAYSAFTLSGSGGTPAQMLAELLLPVAKTSNAEAAFAVVNQGIQVMGGYGYTNDYPLERMARDIRVASIYEGTSGIQALDLQKRKIIGDQGKNARVGGIINTSRGPRHQKATKRPHDRIQPGGCTPNERSQGKQFGTSIVII